MKKLPLSFIALGAAALGLSLAIKLMLPDKAPPKAALTSKSSNRIQQEYETILLYPQKKPLPEFTLYDQFTRPFTTKSFQKKINLLFSGYTNCPDVCPTTLNDLNHIYQALSPEARQNLQIIFLSVDPERDSPETLKQYLAYFNDRFIGISGDKTNIDRVAYALGAVYQLNTAEGEFYSVDHSARLFLVDSQGRRLGLINSQDLSGKRRDILIRELNKLLLSEA